MSAEPPIPRTGRLTQLCRRVCSVALSAPLLYWWTLGYEGDPLTLLILAFLSLIAGVVLFCNSAFCLLRVPAGRGRAISAYFLLLSVAGVVAMPYVLPGWKM